MEMHVLYIYRLNGPSLPVRPIYLSDLPSTDAQNDPKMAGHQLIPLLVASLLFVTQLVALAMAHPYSAPAHGAHVAVQGVVYCQSCERVGTWSLTGAKPLPSAKVSVSCIDNKNRVRFYESFQTDGNGYFYALLQGLELKGSPAALQPLRACKVRLVSSADPKCNLLTNVNYGIAGAPLREANETSYEVVLYSAGPLAFRPAYCPLKPHY
ncbi:hypothetical protein Taro_053910 [Colocasia esculenta]|uniref:Non-classical arabinogalactan protein 30 n=1 Tax=Colocasia esculenta TaxID=4460 RepID=A0A843XMH3_COLES|nr:hypothetical protein [Colocasia esculenta]